jgi:LysM repeat protein
LVVFLIVGALTLFLTLKGTGIIKAATPVPSQTETATLTLTPTDTLIPTDTPTLTPVPPLDHKVASGDTCYSIAALTGVNWTEIVHMNNLDAACAHLALGQSIKVPYPTGTPLPPATATLSEADATQAACNKADYTVQANDTLSIIANTYRIPIQAIKDWNGLSTDTVMLGQKLIIPLCAQAATAGPSPTPTTPPPYPAPNLLLPADGAPFTLANDTVTLQWASVGTLRDNEAYQVTIEDVTAGTGRKLVQYVTDTKLIVPTSFRPQDNTPHVMRWWVVSVRQTGTDDQGNPIWSSAGTASTQRTFSWSGASPAGTPTK